MSGASTAPGVCARHDVVTVTHARRLIEVYGKDKDHPWYLEWSQAIDALACENERLRADVTEANSIIHAAAKFVPNNAPLIIAVEDWLDEHPHPSDDTRTPE